MGSVSVGCTKFLHEILSRLPMHTTQSIAERRWLNVFVVDKEESNEDVSMMTLFMLLVHANIHVSLRTPITLAVVLVETNVLMRLEQPSVSLMKVSLGITGKLSLHIFKSVTTKSRALEVSRNLFTPSQNEVANHEYRNVQCQRIHTRDD